MSFGNLVILFYVLSLVVFVGSYIIEYVIKIYKQPRFVLKSNQIASGSTPFKSSSNSAGWDVYSDETCQIQPGTRQLVSTGLSIEVCPSNCYIRVAPRSGLACRGIDIGAGVIDSDYRGEIKVLVINNSSEVFKIDTFMRIAQFIPEKIDVSCLYFKTKNLSMPIKCITNSKPRQTDGFGSSGR